MQHFNCKILALLLLVCACTDNQTADSQLLVRISQVALRAEPSEKSPEITTLPKNKQLTDLGEVSRFESQIALNGQLYQTPWLKVQAGSNQTGWAPAWALRPKTGKKDWLLQKRLQCYFDKSLTARRNTLIQAYSEIETETQFAQAWRESASLRDTFLGMLARRSEQDFKPQFKWLEDALPGYLYQKIEPGALPALYRDFKVWQEKVLKTKGLQDDILLACYFAAFPVDSTESIFPVWRFPLSENTSVSQLGSGKHLSMLRQIDLANQAGSLFQPELKQLEEQILEDIFGAQNRYWQSSEKILLELDQILADPPKCLSKQELESLQIRRKMFLDPIANGIEVNLRSGE